MLIRTFLIKLGVVYDDSDAKKANKDVEGIGDSAAKAQPKLDKLDKELDDTKKSAKEAGAATEKAGKQIKNTGKKVDATTKQVGKLDRLMGKLGASLASFGPQLAAAGIAGAIAGVGAVIGFVGDETARLDRIAKGAQQAGLGFGAYQRLAQVAKLAGTDIDVLGKGAIKLNRNLSKVAEGRGAEVADNLALLGLTLEDLNGVDPTKQLSIISDALIGVESDVQRTAISMELFGKAGADLVPLLNSGSESIEGMAASVGKIFTREELAQAEAYQDAIANLDKEIDRLKGSAALVLVPAFQRIAEISEATIGPLEDVATSISEDLIDAIEGLIAAATPWAERLAPAFRLAIMGLLVPFRLAVLGLELFARAAATVLEVGETLVGWVDRLATALADRLAPAFKPVGDAITDFLVEPLERVRELAVEVFDTIEGLVDGIGTLGNEVRSVRAAVGLGGGGGSLGAAQTTAQALQGVVTGTAQAQAQAQAQAAGQAARQAERASQREAFVRGEASILRRRAARRPRRGGGRAAATTPAADQGGFLEQLGLTDPGAIMAKRPAPNAMTIIIAPVIKLIEQLVITVQGGASPEQRRALDDAATQARDVIFVKMKELPELVRLMFTGQAKALQSAGSSTTLRGGD